MHFTKGWYLTMLEAIPDNVCPMSTPRGGQTAQRGRVCLRGRNEAGAGQADASSTREQIVWVHAFRLLLAMRLCSRSS